MAGTMELTPEDRALLQKMLESGSDEQRAMAESMLGMPPVGASDAPGVPDIEGGGPPAPAPRIGPGPGTPMRISPPAGDPEPEPEVKEKGRLGRGEQLKALEDMDLDSYMV